MFDNLFPFPYRCQHGVLKICYGEGDLEPFKGELDLTVNGWQDERVLSLREAAHLLNPQNDFQSSCCNCKTGCSSQRCVCRKKGATCSSKCHGGRKCNNCPESADDSDTEQSQRKKRRRNKAKGSDHELALVSSSDDSDTDQPQPKKRRDKKGKVDHEPVSLSDDSDTDQPQTKKGKVVVISSGDECAVADGKWLPELFLRADDKELIETGRWLTDKHVTAAQMLLQKDFPQVNGLQETTLAETGGWKILVTEGVQILNDSNQHWVCVSTIGCPPNTIDIYDSSFKKVTPNIIKQISLFLHCWAPYFTIRIISAQLQQGGSDCALFAIATATCLCHGESPNSILWDQKLMRAHLLKSFEQGKMLPFPGRALQDWKIGTEVVVKDQKVRVYCSCRMPNNRKKMAQCSKCDDWFHQSCENIADAVFRRKAPFVCNSCM